MCLGSDRDLAPFFVALLAVLIVFQPSDKETKAVSERPSHGSGITVIITEAAI